MPEETHFATASIPKLFNAIVNKFLSEPLKRLDSNFTKYQKKLLLTDVTNKEKVSTKIYEELKAFLG
jgi:hypothetical protein